MSCNNGVVSRVLLLAAGLIGAVGVMSAAASSHSGESRNLAAIATICLAHGPALLAIGLLVRGRILAGAGLALALGTLVFAGDLGMREWVGYGLFPGAAPLGGGGMVVGWLGVALGGLLMRADKNN